MIECFFCGKEYIDNRNEATHYMKLPVLFKCEEHIPQVYFSNEKLFYFDHKEFWIVINLSSNKIEIKKSSYDHELDCFYENTIIEYDLPETRDIKEYIRLLDRLLELKIFIWM